MTRAAALRRTVSARMARALAEAAKANGCTASVTFPDGTRVELTPAEAEGQAPKERPFRNMQ